MQLASKAWALVKPSTVSNCWRHAGICPPHFFPLTEQPVPEDRSLSELQGDLNDLARMQPQPATLSVRDFLDVDRDVETEEELTDEMIIQRVEADFSSSLLTSLRILFNHCTHISIYSQFSSPVLKT